MEAVIEYDLFTLLNGAALALFLHRHIHEQTEPAGRAERIDTADLALRVLFVQLLRGDAPGVVCTAQTGRKADVQNVLTLLQDRLKALYKGVGIHCARAGDAALAHFSVKLGEGQLIVGVLPLFAVENVGQPGIRHAPLLEKLRGNVARGVGVNNKFAHG